jgi:hypothetical protein
LQDDGQWYLDSFTGWIEFFVFCGGLFFKKKSPPHPPKKLF